MPYIYPRPPRRPWRYVFASAYELPVIPPRRYYGWEHVWRDVYPTYLQSSTWREKRRVVMAACAGKCACGDIATQVHHLTYEHVFDERPEELLALCLPCHRLAHGIEPFEYA